VSATREYRPEKERNIFDGASQRADKIECGREGDDVFRASAAQAGLQAHDAAEGGRDADGAARVSANAAIAEAGGERSRGTSTGTSCDARFIPGISHRAVVRIVAGRAVGKFVHVGFAEDNGASPFEGRDNRGVTQGNEVMQNLGARRGADTRRVDVVLQGDGDTVQRAERTGALPAAFNGER